MAASVMPTYLDANPTDSVASVKLSITLPEDVARALEALRLAENSDRSTLIAEILRESPRIRKTKAASPIPLHTAPANSQPHAGATGRDGPRTRMRIMEAIRARPGITPTEVCRDLDLAWTTVHHHVRVLERTGAVLCQDRGRHLHLKAVADDTEAQILERLNSTPSIQGLSRDLGLSRKVVRRYLERMMNDGSVKPDAPDDREAL
jgi:DNA-binding transcriptional ArsR family regulator